MENAYGLSRELYVDTILPKFNDIEIRKLKYSLKFRVLILRLRH